MLPEFNKKGYLPPGLYRSDFTEVRQQFGNTDIRQKLLGNLNDFVDVAREVGASKLILDGSFVTDKEEPNDIDAILVVPDNLDTTTCEVHILLESKIRFNIHLFPVRESDEESFQQWIKFFGHDRNGERKGLVEVLL